MTNADLTGADLHGANLTNADLTNAGLRGARLESVLLDLPTGAIWDLNTHWPSHLASRIRDESVEVDAGVYQVRDDPAWDRSGAWS
ncbi:pentapeptide repeat-containing protein [Streptomyces longispororuber]|uniref:pentapeptide repeat-containing protein n=1 Tax=Streptomyces longispororuber TaxID=68230 RepID=UPI0034033D80